MRVGVVEAVDAAGDARARKVESSVLRPLAPARWDWSRVRRVLVVRLRSIGDAVLATPVLGALRRFLPHAEIDVLLEDWVAPVLEGQKDVSRVVVVARGSLKSRLRIAGELRKRRYDVAFNLHGGTTATLLTGASGARHRAGFANYSYGFLHTDLAPHPAEIWNRKPLHSVEQNLALIGWTGVPVGVDLPSRLAVTARAAESVNYRLHEINFDDAPFALVHPAAAFESKRWAVENFARVIEHLHERNLQILLVAAPGEREIVESLRVVARVPVKMFTDLTLPEVTALAARARIFVGNDSGIAHIATAAGAPSVVIFGSSNLAHWRPWNASGTIAETVREEIACQPCPGYTCREFAAPECIRRVAVNHVVDSVDRVLERSANRLHEQFDFRMLE